MRHENEVTAASFSPDGKLIVTASGDKTARVWEAVTGKAVGEPMRHENEVTAAGFSPDGKLIVTASGDKTARVWPQPATDGVFPDRTRRWVEALGTRRFDATGSLLPSGRDLATPAEVSSNASFVRLVPW
jgi:WD40 repeat protein